MSGNELLVLLILAAVLIGPERLPEYAEQVARLVRRVKQAVVGARSRLEAEVGPELGGVDWTQFDPRRYDPRRIVRDALLEERPVRPEPARAASAAAGATLRPGAAPYDDEAT